MYSRSVNNLWLNGFLILGIALAGPQAVVARTYYKWIDESGTTHYSESLPESVDVQESERLELNDDYTTSVSDEDYYSIQNQLQRIQEQRKQLLERQLLKEQSKQVSRPEPEAPPPEQTEAVASPVYTPVLYPPHYQKPYPCYTDPDCGPNHSTGYHHGKPESPHKHEKPPAFNNARKN